MLRKIPFSHPDAAQAVALVEVGALGVQQQRRAAVSKVGPRARRLRVPRVFAKWHEFCRLRLHRMNTM